MVHSWLAGHAYDLEIMKLELPVRVLIADDHPLVRAGVIATLEPHLEFTVSGEVSSGHEVLKVMEEHPCDLLLMDLDMGGPSPKHLIRSCQDLWPELKVVVLSSHLGEEYLAPLEGLGIAGYVVKQEAPECLLQALRVVASGSTWYSQAVQQKALHIASERRINPTLSMLTPREQQVLEKMREGKDNQAIADEMQLSKQTVRRYATIIYQKLGVRSRVEAILSAKSAT